MTFNKYKKRNLIYDGTRIIKVGARELYSYVYRRTWNLTQSEMDQLEKYGLKQAKYIYIGQSSEIYPSDRTAKWKNNIENKHSINDDILEFIDNLKRFYKHELKYSDNMIDNILIPEAEIICRCESREIAKKLEKYFTGHYQFLASFYDSLETQYILLSDRDSNLKTIEKDGILTIEAKKIA